MPSAISTSPMAVWARKLSQKITKQSSKQARAQAQPEAQLVPTTSTDVSPTPTYVESFPSNHGAVLFVGSKDVGNEPVTLMVDEMSSCCSTPNPGRSVAASFQDEQEQQDFTPDTSAPESETGSLAAPKEESSPVELEQEKVVAAVEESTNVDEIVTKVMDILESFSLQQQGNTIFLGRDIFSPRTRRHIQANRTIPMVLPAFPAKSINTVNKVIGPMPDLGEELALDRLNDLCTRVQKVYPPGAVVLIATDGACYNDLTGVTDDNLWQYGLTLRKIVQAKGYKCIDFIRIMNLLGIYTEDTITKEKFIELLEPSRKELMERYGDPNFDANACIKNDPDYKSTYDGYAKFLKKDLAYGVVRDKMTSGKKYKAMVHETAKSMIARGVAFAKLIQEKCPEHVRLSIHPSTGLTKISMPLIPQGNSFSMTPWHCAVAVDVNGNFRTAHVDSLRETHDVVQKHGREYYFRERSDLWNFDNKDVEFEPVYGGGLVVHLGGEDRTQDSLSNDDKQRLANLALRVKKIEVRV